MKGPPRVAGEPGEHLRMLVSDGAGGTSPGAGTQAAARSVVTTLLPHRRGRSFSERAWRLMQVKPRVAPAHSKSRD